MDISAHVSTTLKTLPRMGITLQLIVESAEKETRKVKCILGIDGRKLY